MNRALSDLAEAGVLERKRKAGTRVALLPVRKATLDIPVIRAEVSGRGQTYAYRLLLSELATPPGWRWRRVWVWRRACRCCICNACIWPTVSRRCSRTAG